jgi:hypothetical protein
MRYLALLALILSIPATFGATVHLESIPEGSTIAVEGRIICEETPCTVQMNCGIFDNVDRYVRLTASPQTGYPVRQTIQPCKGESEFTVRFNHRLKPAERPNVPPPIQFQYNLN